MDVISQIARDEGFRGKPYKDSVGVLTIGYGTNLDQGIDEEEGKFLLAHREERKRQELFQKLPWIVQLDEVRLGVLRNMAYNLGVDGLLQFHLTLACIKQGDWDGAAKNMLASKWAAQVGPRATRLAKQIQTGEWQ